jgi:hypothetical protein
MPGPGRGYKNLRQTVANIPIAWHNRDFVFAYKEID